MSSPLPSPLRGHKEDLAKPLPDLSAIDAAMDRARADANRDHRREAFRAELAGRVLVALIPRVVSMGELHAAVADAVNAVDALLARLEGTHG